MTDERQTTLWVEHCPFRKDGTPVLGYSGSSVRPVVIMKLDDWTRLCAELPELAAWKFRVGMRE